jgi:uncharacterized membrane protein (DUF2068 family)
MTHLRQDLTPTRDAGLIAIACFKLAKAVALIGLGFGLFRLHDRSTVDRLTDWLLHLSLSTGQEVIDRVIDLLSTLTQRRVTAFGAGAIAYGMLFGVEGVGLWKGKRWAEFLTVISTGVLIPLEIYELTRRFTIVRVAALALNVLAVIYLIYRLRHPRADSGAGVGVLNPRSARAET